jgi:hypothetical protein
MKRITAMNKMEAEPQVSNQTRITISKGRLGFYLFSLASERQKKGFRSVLVQSISASSINGFFQLPK